MELEPTPIPRSSSPQSVLKSILERVRAKRDSAVIGEETEEEEGEGSEVLKCAVHAGISQKC